MKTQTERQHLDRIASDSWYGRGVNARMVDYTFRVFSRHFCAGRVLELGPAEGLMTELLAPVATRLTVVEGARAFCEDLRRRFPKVHVVHSLFEEFQCDEPFDTIILGHVLEHVADPVAVLKRVATWLRPGGRVLAAVPNARSLHRQAAVLMGLLPFEAAMNEADVHHGHRRIFNPETLRHVFLQADLEIQMFGGYWLKPVSNQQIEKTWTPEMVEAFMQLGERYPDIAAEIYVVASRPGNRRAKTSRSRRPLARRA